MLTVNVLSTLTLKPLLLMALAYVLFRQDQRRSASHQHVLTTAILWGLPCLLLLSFLLPALPFRLTWLAQDVHAFWLQSLGQWVQTPAVQTALALYLFVALFHLFYLALGLHMLKRIERNAIAFEHASTCHLLQHLTGNRQPIAVRVSPDIRTPQVWGWRRPTLLLPPSIATTSPEQVNLILLHELGHVARNDWLIRQMSRVICAVFWFLPPVWWLARRQAALSERATDDWVLRVENRPADYAELLLKSAHSLRQDLPTEALNGSELFQRIQLLLDGNLDRDPRQPEALWLALCVTGLLTLGIGVSQFQPDNSAHYQPHHSRWTWLKEDVSPGARGEGSAAPGPGAATHLPGARPSDAFTQVLRAPGKPLPEMVSVIAPAYQPEAEPVQWTTDIQVGSPDFRHIMPVQVVTPNYPRRALTRGINGRVVLRFAIDPEGRAIHIETLTSPHPLLSQAAAQALADSRFATPRLNGQAFTLTDVIEEYYFQILADPPDT